MPHAHHHLDLDSFVAADAGKTGFWGNMRSYVVSLLKAYWGEAATAGNDFCFDYLPRIDGHHGTYQTVRDMVAGTVKGYFLVGENPPGPGGRLGPTGGPGRSRPGPGTPRPPGRPPIRTRRRYWPRSTAGARAARCRPTPNWPMTGPPVAAAGSTAASTPAGSTRPPGGHPGNNSPGSRRSGAGPGRRTGGSS